MNCQLETVNSGALHGKDRDEYRRWESRRDTTRSLDKKLSAEKAEIMFQRGQLRSFMPGEKRFFAIDTHGGRN
jgi:hypothetical protein